MQRRQFIKKACTGSCALLGGGALLSLITDACKTPLNVYKTSAIKNIISIPTSTFQLHELKIIRINNHDYDVVVRKDAENSYTILVLQCTHVNQPLTCSGNNFYCTAHGSTFDANGKVLKGPAINNMYHLNYHIQNETIKIQLS